MLQYYVIFNYETLWNYDPMAMNWDKIAMDLTRPVNIFVELCQFEASFRASFAAASASCSAAWAARLAAAATVFASIGMADEPFRAWHQVGIITWWQIHGTSCRKPWLLHLKYGSVSEFLIGNHDWYQPKNLFFWEIKPLWAALLRYRFPPSSDAAPAGFEGWDLQPLLWPSFINL